MVTGTAGVYEFVPEDGGAKDEGWSESNMAARLLFVERPGISVMSNAQQNQSLPKNLRSNQKNNLDIASKEPTLRKNGNTQKNAD